VLPQNPQLYRFDGQGAAAAKRLQDTAVQAANAVARGDNSEDGDEDDDVDSGGEEGGGGGDGLSLDR
jgi:hypothetical protein